MELPTDTINRAEVCDWYVRQAVTFYQERVDLGHDHGAARVQALAYLRRKTRWPEAMAAGVLDRALESPAAQA